MLTYHVTYLLPCMLALGQHTSDMQCGSATMWSYILMLYQRCGFCSFVFYFCLLFDSCNFIQCKAGRAGSTSGWTTKSPTKGISLKYEKCMEMFIGESKKTTTTDVFKIKYAWTQNVLNCKGILSGSNYLSTERSGHSFIIEEKERWGERCAKKLWMWYGVDVNNMLWVCIFFFFSCCLGCHFLTRCKSMIFY